MGTLFEGVGAAEVAVGRHHSWAGHTFLPHPHKELVGSREQCADCSQVVVKVWLIQGEGGRGNSTCFRLEGNCALLAGGQQWQGFQPWSG